MMSTPRCLWIFFLRDRWHQIVLHRRSGRMLVGVIVDALGYAGVWTSWSTPRIRCVSSIMNRILLYDDTTCTMFSDARRDGEVEEVAFRLVHRRLGRAIERIPAPLFLAVVTTSRYLTFCHVKPACTQMQIMPKMRLEDRN
ncbi:hypothetical protein P171DRAFT_145776 [Karstenula rhodostoma CBS 690.94]|uniref:Uncharacterized protein n=1 Tax=Karstenula rhodostoma CBS 690.94 TaxID=1392251 RepID=A0A9P4PUN2_9PLEO|nr:hypothetical protein P171DRAFT_145776 [Karstenula rhodostoma CBS 690.94]